MRLFDKCVSQNLIHPNDAKDAIVLTCDPVADYARDVLVAKGGLAYEDAPYSTPPWNICFAEFNYKPIRDNDLTQFGTLARVSREFQHIDTFNRVARENGHPGVGKIETVVWHDIFCFWNNRVGGFTSWLAWACSGDGTIFWYTGYPNKLDGEKSRFPMDSDVLRSMNWYLKIVAMAFTFANCCNVKLQDVTDDLQPEPKIRRRLKIPDVKRYTLNICGHFTKPSRNANEPQQGVMPFHLCRGHFATYTADKPMFGNPKLVGRYWHPPHMRGKKENGVIEKDYAIREAAL